MESYDILLNFTGYTNREIWFNDNEMSMMDTMQSGSFKQAKPRSKDGSDDFMAKDALGAKIEGNGRPNYDKYIVPNKDPSAPPNAGSANVFMNNLLTSGINTSALFRGI